MGDDGFGNTRDFSIPGYVPAKGEDMEVITDFEGLSASWAPPCARAASSKHTRTPHPEQSPSSMNRWRTGTGPKETRSATTLILDKRPRRIVGIVRDYAYSDPANTDPEQVLFFNQLGTGV